MLIRSAIFLFLISCFLGCGSSSRSVSFQVMIPKESNQGRPLYMIAKPTEVRDFYIDDYQNIASQSFFDSKDESLVKKVLIPGSTQTVKFTVPDKETPVAVYFLFTEPNEEWKLVFKNPHQNHHKIFLAENGVQSSHTY